MMALIIQEQQQSPIGQYRSDLIPTIIKLPNLT
jgi:hypothetical protein